MHKPTLTIEEAGRIVSMVEHIFTSPKLPWGYKLSELQGYSRIDVAHAFMINIAHVYKDGRHHPDFESEVSKLINGMDSSLIHIATGGIPDSELGALGNSSDLSTLIDLAGKWSLIPMPGDSDSNPALSKEREVFGKLEMPSSIAKYCSEVLKPHDPEYWQKVYSHVGLKFPSSKLPNTASNVSTNLNQSKQPDVSNMSSNELAGFNHGRSSVGLHPLKPYRAWQVRLYYGVLFLLYASICAIWLTRENVNEEMKYLIGVGSGLNAAAYLFMYFDKRKNNLIILGVVALMAGVYGLITGIFQLYLPIITFVLTVIFQLIRWNRKKSEWSQMWFE